MFSIVLDLFFHDYGVLQAEFLANGWSELSLQKGIRKFRRRHFKGCFRQFSCSASPPLSLFSSPVSSGSVVCAMRSSRSGDFGSQDSQFWQSKKRKTVV